MREGLLACLLLCSTTACVLDPLVRVDVTVVGEDGLPIEEASVRGDFAGVASGSGDVVLESTNDEGAASVSGRSFFPARVIARKAGFYTSTIEVNTAESVGGKKVYKDRVARVVLRGKRNPIPLYAKRYTGYIPVANVWLGFDFEKADWVSPYGHGVMSDLQFKYDGYDRGFWDAKGRLDMRFSNPADGLVDVSGLVDMSSELKVPHIAPDSGYDNDGMWWEISTNRKEGRHNWPSAMKYYFLRVRSVARSDGSLASANYAKVYHDFNFFFSDKDGAVAGVNFDYYFNPNSNDRNLEFDTRRNLFQGVSHDERVFVP